MGDSPETPFDLFRDYLRFASSDSFRVALFVKREMSAFVLWRPFTARKVGFFSGGRLRVINSELNCLSTGTKGRKVSWRRCFWTASWSFHFEEGSNYSLYKCDASLRKKEIEVIFWGFGQAVNCQFKGMYSFFRISKVSVNLLKCIVIVMDEIYISYTNNECVEFIVP